MQNLIKIILTLAIILIWSVIVWNIEEATGVKPSRSLAVALTTLIMVIAIRATWRHKKSKNEN